MFEFVLYVTIACSIVLPEVGSEVQGSGKKRAFNDIVEQFGGGIAKRSKSDEVVIKYNQGIKGPVGGVISEQHRWLPITSYRKTPSGLSMVTTQSEHLEDEGVSMNLNNEETTPNIVRVENEISSQVELLELQRSELQKELDSERRTKLVSDEDVNRCNAQLKDLKEQLNYASKAISAIDDAKTTLVSLHTQTIHDLKASYAERMEERQKQIVKLQEELGRDRLTRAELQEELHRNNRQFGDIKADHTKRIEELNEQLADARRALEETRATIESNRAEMSNILKAPDLEAQNKVVELQVGLENERQARARADGEFRKRINHLKSAHAKEVDGLNKQLSDALTAKLAIEATKIVLESRTAEMAKDLEASTAINKELERLGVYVGGEYAKNGIDQSLNDVCRKRNFVSLDSLTQPQIDRICELNMISGVAAMQNEKVIKDKSKMDADWQSDAVKVARKASRKFADKLVKNKKTPSLKEIATFIKEEFNILTGDFWHCIVGTNFEFSIEEENLAPSFKFRLGQIDVLLW